MTRKMVGWRVRIVGKHPVAFALLCLGLNAFAQSPDEYASQESFRAMLRRNDFASIELIRKSLIADGRRSERGIHLADVFGDPTSFVAELSICNDAGYIGAAATQAPSFPSKDDCWASVESRMAKWRADFPASTMPIQGLSDAFYLRAWYVDRNRPDHAQTQDTYLSRSVAILEEIPRERRDVLWYRRMMQSGTLQGWGSKKFLRLLSEAASRFPDHEMVYRQAIVHFLPRNGGTAAEIEAVATLAVSRNAETLQMLTYAAVYDEVIMGAGNLGETASTKTHVSWPKLRQSLRLHHRLHPAQWNLNRFAQHACLAFDMATLQELLFQIPKNETPLSNDGWHKGELVRCRALVQRQPLPKPGSANATVASASAVRSR